MIFSSLKKSFKYLWIGFVGAIGFLGPPLSAQNASSGFQLRDVFANQAWYAQGGLSFAFGTHVNRIGLRVQIACAFDYGQFNAQWAFHRAFKDLGPDKARWENQLALGGVAALGKQRRSLATQGEEVDFRANHFYAPITDEGRRQYAVGYAYIWYRDKIRTSQNSGAFSFRAADFHLILENDLFAGRGSDKFRTGAFLVAYQYEEYQFALNATLYTGNPKAKGKQRIKNTDYPSRFGYFSYGHSEYASCSHGFFSAQVRYNGPYRQTVGMNIGLDAEKVRHALQNKLIHDMPIVPKSWNKAENPHVPMIAEDGSPYLFKEGQRIKKPSPFLTLYLNPSMFY